MSSKAKGKKAVVGKAAKKGPSEQDEDEVPQAVVCREALLETLHLCVPCIAYPLRLGS